MNLKAIKNKIFNGKNPKFIYYIRAYVMTHIPRALLRPALSKLDSIIEQRADRDYILDRVNYYCKNSSYPEVDPKKWAEASVNVGNQPMTRQRYIITMLWSMPATLIRATVGALSLEM